tara:strand:- start:609 stop:887 length:279 start_codon:yes stop_codon:yes gene_type:complete
MTDAPEKIAVWRFLPSKANEWLLGGWSLEHDRKTTEYTRTDVADAREVTAINLVRYFADTANTQQARIKELEAALRSIGNEVSIARAALKGE